MKFLQFYEHYWQNPEKKDTDETGLAVQPRKRLLKRALGDVSPPARVLDAGCGSGVFTRFLSELGYTVFGADISLNATTYARKRTPTVFFQVTMVETGLPYRAEYFSAIWFSEVLEHVFDVHAALAELNRVLKPGGKLILTTPYHGLVKNMIIVLKGYEQHYNPYLSHIRFFSRNSLTECLERAGFAIEQWQGVGRMCPVWKSQFVVCRKAQLPEASPEIVG